MNFAADTFLISDTVSSYSGGCFMSAGASDGTLSSPAISANAAVHGVDAITAGCSAAIDASIIPEQSIVNKVFFIFFLQKKKQDICRLQQAPQRHSAEDRKRLRE